MKKKLLRLLGGVPKHELEYFHKNVEEMAEKLREQDKELYELRRLKNTYEATIKILSEEIGKLRPKKRKRGRPKGSKNKKKDPRLNYSK